MSELNPAQQRTREIAREVLVEAFGASATPFVPVPFVDDYLLGRLLRRVARKVLARHGQDVEGLPKAIVKAYVDAGASSLASSIVVGAARFVVRKVAMVLDVKKSHDVFGECIAFALGLDIAASNGWATPAGAAQLGAAMHRTLKVVGSGTVEGLARAGREAFAKGSHAGGSRLEQLSEAVAAEVEKTRNQLESVLRNEVQRPPGA